MNEVRCDRFNDGFADRVKLLGHFKGGEPFFAVNALFAAASESCGLEVTTFDDVKSGFIAFGADRLDVRLHVRWRLVQ